VSFPKQRRKRRGVTGNGLRQEKRREKEVTYGTKTAKGEREQLGKKGGKKGTMCGKYASKK